jgi:TM2 domain-containing membrane protein YozV
MGEASLRGTVLAFDFRSGEGKISGDDGNRYSFHAREWQGTAQPVPNQPVDFEASESDALAIYPMRAAGPLAGGAGSTPNRIAAALLAFFLGALGIHKFYMGKGGTGAVMLVISLFGMILAGIPSMIMALVALIEFVIYLTMSDEQFEATYIKGGKDWF